MCFGCYRIICVVIFVCCFYSKIERKSIYECVRCLKVFMNNKVSRYFLFIILCYLNFNVILFNYKDFFIKNLGGFLVVWFFFTSFYFILNIFFYIM